MPNGILVAAKKSFELTKGQLWPFFDFRFSRSLRGHRTCFHIIIIGMISLKKLINFPGQFIAYILLILMVLKCLTFEEFQILLIWVTRCKILMISDIIFLHILIRITLLTSVFLGFMGSLRSSKRKQLDSVDRK